MRFDQKYVETIKKSSEISALDSGSFGEKIDISSGSAQFLWTDIDIPGNSDLPVRLQRSFVVENSMPKAGSELPGFGTFGVLDIPYLKGIHTNAGWQVTGASPNARCTAAGPPPASSPISVSDYWNGNMMHIPWENDKTLLHGLAASTPKPAWSTTLMTKDMWAFKCSSTTKNAYPGEGFIAVSPNGEKYHFDYVVTKSYPGLSKRYGNYAHNTAYLERKAVYFLLSRIEDRFGNWVNYEYVGDQLQKISSDDGRYIQITWLNGKVSSVSSSKGTWQYAYPSTTSMVVTLPDASTWQAAFTGGLEIEATPSLPLYDSQARCPAPEPSTGNYSLAVKLPSNATASYTFTVKRHAQSNVPKLCNSFIDESLNSYQYLTIPNFIDAFTLVSKSITGPGLPSMQWSYSYAGGSGLAFEDICANPPSAQACPTTRRTEITGPDNLFERYTFGNMYKMNSGQLLMKEIGRKIGNSVSIEQTTLNTYVADGDLDGQPFPDKVGSAGNSRMDDVSQAGLRPVRRTDILQDGAIFTSDITAFDAYARPIRIVKSSVVATPTYSPGSGGIQLPPAATPTISAPATSSSGAFALAWSSVSGASSYEVRQRLAGAAWATLSSTPNLSLQVSGKSTGTWSFAVRACNGAGCSSWSQSASVVVTLPPSSAPVVTAPSSNSSGSYSVNWSSIAGATNYELREQSNGGNWTTIQSSSGTSFAASGRASGSWGYSARACNTGGCSAWSATASVAVVLPPSTAPGVSAPSTSYNGAFSVSWTSVAGATSYQLREQLGGGAWATIQNASSTSRSITGKSSGTWGYAVQACNNGGCSAWSATKNVVVTLPPSSAPSLTVAATNTSGSYVVSWSSVSGATRYELDRSANSAGWVNAVNGSSLSLSVSDQWSGRYDYRVRACNVAGCSGYSGSKQIAVTRSLATTTITAARQVSGRDYVVAWNQVSYATRYELEQTHIRPAFTNTRIIYDGPDNIYDVLDTTAGSTYNYRVRGCDIMSCGAYSATKGFSIPGTTPGPGGPGQAAAVTATDLEGETE